MRARGSYTGPLIIIGLGVLFLLHAISPDFPVLDFIGQYWPYILIAWGVISLMEVASRTLLGHAVPVNGVSGGAWFVVVLICLIGLAAFEFQRPNAWWGPQWWRGFDRAFGEPRSYAVESIEKQTGTAPRIVIEEFRGDAKVTGSDEKRVVVGGHKTIRATKDELADQANSASAVEVIERGDELIIRCNQNRADSRTSITTDLEISVPKGSSLEANGSVGDFDVSSLAGNVAIRSGNSGVRLQDLGGNVSVETRRSDVVRCTNVSGTVDLRGHGSDVELTKIGGPVTVEGDYTGTVSMRELSKPVHVHNSRTQLRAAQISGEARLDRGSLNVQGAIGPMQLTAHSTDVTLENFSDSIDISVDRGDIDLKPERLPLGKMAVHSGSGNIELAVPQSASFALMATTNHGSIENEFGEALREETAGHGARLEGTVGTGPELNLATERGTVTVRKASATSEGSSGSVAARAKNEKLKTRAIVAAVVP